jgi:hypothetical protein
MNKEQQELLNEAYNRYSRHIDSQNKLLDDTIAVYSTKTNQIVDKEKLQEIKLSKEEFINKCKTDNEFSERWGLKIEGRELSLEERHNIALPIWKEQYGPLADMMVPTNVDNTPFKIPTKIITITYKDKTIESYE